MSAGTIPPAVDADREPWRLWVLLSPQRGTTGREIRYGWSSIANLQQWAEARLKGLNLRAEHADTGERWNRVAGAWSRVADRAAPQPDAEPPSDKPRYYWQDRD